jgi:hypothetical protein
MYTIGRLAAAVVVLVAAWLLVSHTSQVRRDTVRCTEVHHGGSVTVLWEGREERIELPGRALELRYTEELRRRARKAGVSEREMFRRAWLDREALAERVRGEYVRLAWPEGRGARDEQGRLIAELRTKRGTVVASGSYAMGN